MINKFKKWFYVNKRNQEKILNSSREIEWAHVFHDSIKGKPWLENLPLNIGRWAGNYAFFYVLNRVMNDFKPKSIMELGLGESSKFITAYLENQLKETTHLIIEQDSNWKKIFLDGFKITNRTDIKISPLEKKIIKGYEVNSYKGFDELISSKHDLYIVDGPFGSNNFSRYDIVTVANGLDINDDFIIIIDDYHRKGEKETTNKLLAVFKEKNIEINFAEYSGNKSLALLATKKYKYATTL